MNERYSIFRYILTKMLRQSICLYFIFRKVNILKVIACHFSKNASYIVWIPKAQWASATIIKSMAIFSALSKCGSSVKIFSGKNIGRFHNKKIYFCLNKKYSTHGFSNYTYIIKKIVYQLERQNNIVYPSSNDIEYWEDKSYMYKQFLKMNVPHPKTEIISSADQKINIRFPLIVKEIHSSGGIGVHKVENKKELDLLVNKKEFKKNNNSYIVQELMDIRRDLRVTVVHDKVMSSYWRINTSISWQKTSTNFGSKLDFNNLPASIFDEIITITKNLGLQMAAYDIIFLNDNINDEYKILEVSPTHSSNPKIENQDYLDYPGSFKKRYSIFPNKSYDYHYVKFMFELHKVLVDGEINNLKY